MNQSENKDIIISILAKLNAVNNIKVLRLILSKFNDDIIWSITRKERCHNEKAWNLQSGEQHEDDNKNNLKDPIISYGNSQNYVCYPLSELLFYWKPSKIKELGMFTRPDYMDGDELPRELTNGQMNSLIPVLNKSKQRAGYNTLISQIRNGMKYATSPGDRFIKNAPQIYRNFSAEEKKYIHQALAHLMVIRVFTYDICDNDKRFINTSFVANQYFGWVSSLSIDVGNFINSFYWIYQAEHTKKFYPVENNMTSKDGTNISYINGKIKIVLEGNFCMVSFAKELLESVTVYHDLFIYDMSYDIYRDTIEKEMRDIIGTSDINLNENFEIHTDQIGPILGIKIKPSWWF